MNAINWFEIPTANLDRAERFYSQLLGKPMRREIFNGEPHAIFAHEPKAGVGGALVASERLKPSAEGSVVYLGTAELEACLQRVQPAGGAVVLPLTDIGEPGFVALIRDSEGNVVGLHQPRR